MHRVDRDIAKRKIFVEITIRRHVAAAPFQAHLDVERTAAAERCDMQTRIENFDVGVALDVAGGNFSGPRFGNRQGLGFAAVQLEWHLLEIEDDVGSVLNHAFDRREFVLDALDLYRGDRRPFN